MEHLKNGQWKKEASSKDGGWECCILLPELKKTQVFSKLILPTLVHFRNTLSVTKLKLFSRAFFWAQSHICSFIRLEVTFKWRCASQNFISQLEEKEAVLDWKLLVCVCLLCTIMSINAHLVANHGFHMKVTQCLTWKMKHQ